ncbi:hypothetical protein [Blastopirellula marina]|uniref:Bacterial transcription activator effector binding domain-containing protein n=1 Tax=Blastopirellula marina TaxID=124 RepID=A0A2S8GIG6_9BACT|nr:hypothetical protein [Blastopirellula marina]PQO44237.1 hypothetical protein C5Y93_19945 [Blastopirellula marina]
METEIHDTPLTLQLYGKSAPIGNDAIGAVGLRLMDAVWRIVAASRIETTGINHWVYLPQGRLFVGVAIPSGGENQPELEACSVTLRRYLRHLHVGPYQALPAKWQALKQRIADRGDVIGPKSLEIYGHHCDDPARMETTILIGLL